MDPNGPSQPPQPGGPPPEPAYPPPPPAQPGYPPPPPTQPGYPQQPGYPPTGPADSPTSVYQTPPPPPGGYPQQPAYPPQPGAPGTPDAPGRPVAPPPGGPPVYTPPPSSDDNRMRNVVVGVIVALILVLLAAAAYAFVSQPAKPSFPAIIPTATPAAEPTKTPKATPTEAPVQTQEAPTEKPTKEPQTEPPAEPTPTEVAAVSEPPATQGNATQGPGNPTPGASFVLEGTEDQGLILGTPVILGDPTFPTAALLVQNVDPLVKSYTIKATWKNGNKITATGDGLVSDHFQGSIRTATLSLDANPGPNDTVTVAIDTMFDQQPSTANADIAQQITFGPPTVIPGDFPSIDVEVTNGSQTSISATVDAAVVRDGVLVGVGQGLVTDFNGGETQTVTLYVTGSIEETDLLIFSVDSVLASE